MDQSKGLHIARVCRKSFLGVLVTVSLTFRAIGNDQNKQCGGRKSESGKSADGISSHLCWAVTKLGESLVSKWFSSFKLFLK